MENVKWVGSPNKTKGRGGYKPEAIVIHIMEGSLTGTDSWFVSPKSKVSAHYGIGVKGEIHQYVAEGDSAWHAGRVSGSEWKGLRSGVNPNSYTIGIEHEGKADSEWTEAMYMASARLIAEIANRWSIPLDRYHVIGHREIFDQKTCPGSKVDLNHLVLMARSSSKVENVYNLCTQTGLVRTKTDLNIRKGAPTTAAPIKNTVKGGTVLNFVGWTSNGLVVNGNAHWYRTQDGDYFWAGATEQPVPGVRNGP